MATPTGEPFELTFIVFFQSASVTIVTQYTHRDWTLTVSLLLSTPCCMWQLATSSMECILSLLCLKGIGINIVSRARCSNTRRPPHSHLLCGGQDECGRRVCLSVFYSYRACGVEECVCIRALSRRATPARAQILKLVFSYP